MKRTVNYKFLARVENPPSTEIDHIFIPEEPTLPVPTLRITFDRAIGHMPKGLKRLVGWLDSSNIIGISQKVLKRMARWVESDHMLTLTANRLSGLRIPGDIFPIRRPIPVESDSWEPSKGYNPFLLESDI